MTVETSATSSCSSGAFSRMPYNPFSAKSSSPSTRFPPSSPPSASQPGHNRPATPAASSSVAPHSQQSTLKSQTHDYHPGWVMHEVPLLTPGAFRPVVELERGRGGGDEAERGGNRVTAMSLCTLTAAPELSGWSLEELRFRMYDSIPNQRTWPKEILSRTAQQQRDESASVVQRDGGVEAFMTPRLSEPTQKKESHGTPSPTPAQQFDSAAYNEEQGSATPERFWAKERGRKAEHEIPQNIGKGENDERDEFSHREEEGTVRAKGRGYAVRKSPSVEDLNVRVNSRNPLFKENNVSRILPVHCVGTWDVSETDAAEANELCLPMPPYSEPLVQAESPPHKQHTSPLSRNPGSEERNGSSRRHNTAGSHANGNGESDAAKWIATQLPLCTEFTQLIEEAMRSQTRQLMLERDRALEQRDVAEKQAISARMEAESAQEDVEDMRERCDAELAKMGARLEAAVADRDGVQRVLERMSAEQGASLQVRQALKEEIQDALEQSNVVEEECEQLRMRVRELEVEVERERLGRARMAQELARAQAAAQQGIALKKQLAASVLHALDLSATSQPLWGGSEEDDKGLKVGCPQNNEVSNSPSRQERRSSPHQYRGQTEEGKVGVVGEGNDEGDEKTSKPAASMFGKYQPRKLMRLRRDSIAPESEGSVKTL